MNSRILLIISHSLSPEDRIPVLYVIGSSYKLEGIASDKERNEQK